jgi:hypothetical protein
MIMKRIPKLTLLLTLLWLAVLAYFTFFTNVSSTITTMIYIMGQGFLVALVIAQGNKKSTRCRTSKTLDR